MVLLAMIRTVRTTRAIVPTVTPGNVAKVMSIGVQLTPAIMARHARKKTTNIHVPVRLDGPGKYAMWKWSRAMMLPSEKVS